MKRENNTAFRNAKNSSLVEQCLEDKENSLRSVSDMRSALTF